MITASIIGIRRLGAQVFVQYSLTDGTDGEIEVIVGSDSAEIQKRLQVIADAATYAVSLKPMIASKSAVQVP